MSEEKISRSYEAIALYNNTVATGDDDRLAVTNQALRELSGVNGLLVGDWIKSHADSALVGVVCFLVNGSVTVISPESLNYLERLAQR